MGTKTIHFGILIVSLVICLFMYLDAYWLPCNASEEITLKANDFQSRGKSSTTHSYLLTTNVGTYSITESLYRGISIGDTVYIERSSLTSVSQKAFLYKGEYIYMYEIGFLRARNGFIFTPMLLLGIIAFLLFYNKLDNLQGRVNMTYALFIGTLILFLFYLDLDMFI